MIFSRSFCLPIVLFCSLEVCGQDGASFLKTFCYDCHGQADWSGTGLDVTDFQELVKVPPGRRPAYLVAGDPEASLLARRVKDGSMPPASAVEDLEDLNSKYRLPTQDEREAFYAWIKTGALTPTKVQRKFIPDGVVYDKIGDLTRFRADKEDEILSFAPSELIHKRFFTIHHLHNNQAISVEHLRIQRAALSKLLNSLSHAPDIKLPQVIDREDETVFVIDLRDYGWDRDTWELIVADYPYGILHSEDEALENEEIRLQQNTGTQFPLIRADWFVATASRPPIYDRVLELPGSLPELELSLKVNYLDNFEQNKIIRAGMISSGVSRHNRMVERHTSRDGYYWRSFDFESSDELGNLIRLPLGPQVLKALANSQKLIQRQNPFKEFAFKHAGGEVIFSLPNGLQGYMLADALDNRLDIPAPISIVRDLRESAGTPEISNGLSCISCHDKGILDVRDVVLQSSSLEDRDKRKVQKLYSEQLTLDRQIREDRQLFLRALEKTIGPFLQVGDDKHKSVLNFAEPVKTVSKRYFDDLGLLDVASELNHTPDQFKAIVKGNAGFKKLGLLPLLNESGLKRELWENPVQPLFHKIADDVGFKPLTTKVQQRQLPSTASRLPEPYHTPTTETKDANKTKGQGAVAAKTLPKPSPVESFQSSVGATMMKVSKGKFTMGSGPNEKGRKDDESSAAVILSGDFFVAETELTQGQYSRLMNEDFSELLKREGLKLNAGYGRDFPVYGIGFEDAKVVCEKLTNIDRERGVLPSGFEYRLPTEAEWEYACRGGSSAPFSTDNVHYDAGSVREVGQGTPNAFGLKDMHGNVAEWCLDGYQKKLVGGKDPFVQGTGYSRICRGGSWCTPLESCRAAARAKYDASVGHKGVGLRLFAVPVR